jgi:hypothetical protein
LVVEDANSPADDEIAGPFRLIGKAESGREVIPVRRENGIDPISLDEQLVRGSGLFVGETGIAANHHFLAPSDGSSFRFTEGRYRMDVFARLVGDRHRTLLFSQTLDVSRESAAQLAEPDCGLYFDWGPDSSRYLPHIDKRPALPNEDFRELLNVMRRSRSRSGP